MAHPMQAHRQHIVERKRVSHITKGYDSGGEVGYGEAQQNQHNALNDAPNPANQSSQYSPQSEQAGPAPRDPDIERLVSGRRTGRARARGGRVDSFARGGKTKKGKGTTVNVMMGHGDKQAVPVPVPAPATLPGGAGPLPPRPPVLPPAGAAPPGMPPGGPPGMPPPGIRRSGGRAYARGGGVKSGPTWDEGKRNGTQVTHSPGKNDSDKINTRPALLTRKRGGRAYPLTAGADSGVGRLQLTAAQRKFKAP
jgi:hypothetical protein